MRNDRVPILERRMVDAYRAGRQCAESGQPRRNPFDGAADTAEERVLSVMWARGYSAGNPMPPIDDDGWDW